MNHEEKHKMKNHDQVPRTKKWTMKRATDEKKEATTKNHEGCHDKWPRKEKEESRREPQDKEPWLSTTNEKKNHASHSEELKVNFTFLKQSFKYNTVEKSHEGNHTMKDHKNEIMTKNHEG